MDTLIITVKNTLEHLSKIGANNLFYYFSTVAQSMAAIIAFLGVFVVFRMQYLDGKMNTLYRAIDERTTSKLFTEFVGEINLIEQVTQIIEEKKELPQFTERINKIKKLIDEYKSFEKQRETIRRYFKWPTICSLISIITAFIGILLIKSQSPTQDISILIINIVLTIVSLTLVIILLFRSLKSEVTTK